MVIKMIAVEGGSKNYIMGGADALDMSFFNFDALPVPSKGASVGQASQASVGQASQASVGQASQASVGQKVKHPLISKSSPIF